MFVYRVNAYFLLILTRERFFLCFVLMCRLTSGSSFFCAVFSNMF